MIIVDIVQYVVLRRGRQGVGRCSFGCRLKLSLTPQRHDREEKVQIEQFVLPLPQSYKQPENGDARAYAIQRSRLG